jgi:hypothetical protein
LSSQSKAPPAIEYQFREEEIEVRRTPNKVEKQIQLTYWTDMTPPRTIWIPAQGYDEKARAKAIREDQEKLARVKQGTVKV